MPDYDGSDSDHGDRFEDFEEDIRDDDRSLYESEYTPMGPTELQPLPKPQSLLSRYEWSQREPIWYQDELDKESHRVARNYLGKLYRNVQQEKLGVVLYQTVQPWPPYLPGPDKGPPPKNEPRKIYNKAPFELKVGFQREKKYLPPDPLTASAELVQRKREVQKHLHDFGKAVGGAPYDRCQTTSRIEAKSQFRKAKWQLSKSGPVGPLGPMEAIGFDYPAGKSRAGKTLTTPFSTLNSTYQPGLTQTGSFTFLRKGSGSFMNSSLPGLMPSSY